MVFLTTNLTQTQKQHIENDCYRAGLSVKYETHSQLLFCIVFGDEHRVHRFGLALKEPGIICSEFRCSGKKLEEETRQSIVALAELYSANLA